MVGDPARAAMLVTLMDGRALTSGELGKAAGVAPPTASGHLMRMLEAGLLALEQQGRHRYYRLAGASVAGLIESMMALSEELSAAATQCKPVRTGPRDTALRQARLCYDHLAGEIAVALADRMIEREYIELGTDGGVITAHGSSFLTSLDLGLMADIHNRERGIGFCRPCLDWSERRPHIAGAVGRSLYDGFVRQGWLRRVDDTRAVSFSPKGALKLRQHFSLELSSPNAG